jgi:ketosteroid isomerase-like protein
MRHIVVAITLATFIVAGSAGHAEEARPDSVIAAEYAFAASAKPLGVRGAFLKYLAPDSILCSPAPVNGIVATTANKPNADTLEWYPAHSITAGSDDLGYSTGPWTFRSADGKTERHGTFLSMWRRQLDGSWKVALDCGVSQPKPDVAPPRLPVPKPSKKSANAGASAGTPNLQDAVGTADAKFASAASQNGPAALRDFGASDVRVMANGAPTAAGIEQGQKLVSSQNLGTTWQMVFASQSQDGTLGYTWGNIGDPQSEKPSAVYVNVWRRANTSAPWQIIAQSLQILPPPKQ